MSQALISKTHSTLSANQKRVRKFNVYITAFIGRAQVPQGAAKWSAIIIGTELIGTDPHADVDIGNHSSLFFDGKLG